MKSISRTSSLGRLSIIVEGEIDSRSFDRDTFPVIGCSGWINKHLLGSGRNCCNGETLAHFPQGGSDRGNGLERRGRKIRMDFYYYYYYYFRKTKGERFCFGGVRRKVHSMEKRYIFPLVMIVEPWRIHGFGSIPFFPDSQPTFSREFVPGSDIT